MSIARRRSIWQNYGFYTENLTGESAPATIRDSREAVWVREGSRSLDQPKVSPTRDVSLVLSVGHLYNICHLALIRF